MPFPLDIYLHSIYIIFLGETSAPSYDGPTEGLAGLTLDSILENLYRFCLCACCPELTLWAPLYFRNCPSCCSQQYERMRVVQHLHSRRRERDEPNTTPSSSSSSLFLRCASGDPFCLLCETPPGHGIPGRWREFVLRELVRRLECAQ